MKVEAGKIMMGDTIRLDDGRMGVVDGRVLDMGPGGSFMYIHLQGWGDDVRVRPWDEVERISEAGAPAQRTSFDRWLDEMCAR